MVRVLDNALFINTNNIQWICNKKLFLPLLLGKIKEDNSSMSVMLMSSQLPWVTLSGSFNFDKTSERIFFRYSLGSLINKAQSFNVLIPPFTEAVLAILKWLAVDSIFDDGPSICSLIQKQPLGVFCKQRCS